ncbi:zf-HC2 domain-containing protein [Geodermatophilus sp. YIM 151500]|uniref:anti-sigma factor family protein n=1 Tax=Geodermatophilus sp. YIM 151500 TaxID=2984531 RepID=UPI0021E4A9FF|nr:zf-HC2 domain-containing protein [Geodermatophilus sp. YIM 151500]MCV2489043.1 zf-HC2 domain-containing protein [Geodermatophilus sp. YIM 151500]
MNGEPGTGGTEERCVDLVEQLTAYLDGTLPVEERRRIEQHLERCEGCRTALAQWRTVVRLAGRLTTADVADVDPLLRDRLMATFLEARRR